MKNLNFILKKKFTLTSKEIKEIKEEKSRYENPKAALIAALKIIQRKRGWVEDDAINFISNFLNIPMSEIEEITTFYSHIYRRPVGKYVIRYCDSIVCYINGYKKVKSKISTLLKISSGETTSDNRFTLLPTCCLGNCNKGPVIMINDNTHNAVNCSNISKILKQYL